MTSASDGVTRVSASLALVSASLARVSEGTSVEVAHRALEHVKELIGSGLGRMLPEIEKLCARVGRTELFVFLG